MTNYCPLRCPHCYRDAKTRLPDELTTEECLSVIDQLASLKPRLVVFSGGEPLARPDIVQLVEYAVSRGLTVAVATSGLLVREELVAELARAGLRYVAISLDSAKPETHDRFRGVPGLYDKVLEAIKLFRKHGVEVQLNFTLHRGNREELLDVLKLAEKLGVRLVHVFQFLPSGRGKALWQELALSLEETLELCLRAVKESESIIVKPTCIPQFWPFLKRVDPDLYQRLTTRYTPGCIAGTKYIYISPRGEVQPCPYVEYVIGNIRERSLRDILESSPVIAALRERKFRGACGECSYREICGGCRARALVLKGDLFEEDPGCPLRTSSSRSQQLR